ncbi:MAG: hypothetical protein KDJ77_12110 [Rhodobiaceae bacterium]|nr:hypothetical protein [Rhodobiaceae bacterium]
MTCAKDSKLIEILTLQRYKRSTITVTVPEEEEDLLPNRRAIRDPLTLPEWPTKQ